MISLINEILSYPFMVRALLAGASIALCSSLLGVPLVLKRYSMIGDGLSHVAFGALAIANSFNWAPLSVSIPLVLISAFFLLRISENSKIRGDSAIALISIGSLAIGVMILSLTKGMNTDVYNYLFGTILGMSQDDVYISLFLSSLVLILFIILYNRIFAITFDETFASATGISSKIYNMGLALLTALVIVLGMRMMGSLLITSLIVFPSLTSLQVFKTFKSVSLASSLISLTCFFSGFLISYAFSTPTGASIVICNILIFTLFSLLKKSILK